MTCGLMEDREREMEQKQEERSKEKQGNKKKTLKVDNYISKKTTTKKRAGAQTAVR